MLVEILRLTTVEEVIYTHVEYLCLNIRLEDDLEVLFCESILPLKVIQVTGVSQASTV